MTTTQIVMLGTGTPMPDTNRAGSATAIVVNDQPYLIDFGPSVVLRAVQAHQRKGIVGLETSRLTRAFLTHMHADHSAGYADLIFTTWIQHRAQPLEAYGPVGFRSMTDHLMTAYEANIEEHLTAHPVDPDGYKVNAHEIESGQFYQDANVSVEAFPVQHSGMVAFGFKFITPDKTIIISGDTCPVDTLIEAAQSCDVLIHEVYSIAGCNAHTPEWQAYHKQAHTSAYELADIANKVQPGLLILYHQLWWSASEEILLAEVREKYSGEVVSAKDLDVF